MSRFEYLSALMSIVIGFAMSEALSGWGQMIRLRDVLAALAFSADEQLHAVLLGLAYALLVAFVLVPFQTV